MTAIIYSNNLREAFICELNNPDTREQDIASLDLELDRYLDHVVALGVRAGVAIEVETDGPSCWRWIHSGTASSGLWEEIQDEGFWVWYS